MHKGASNTKYSEQYHVCKNLFIVGAKAKFTTSNLIQVFGPVQQIYRFKDISEVIDRANNTLYGLAAAVITNDINKAISISNAMEAGTVWYVANRK